MDTRTKENSVATLKRLRDVYQGQLDASVIGELNAVIAALEQSGEGQNKRDHGNMSTRALVLIGEVVRLVTNITDLMK